MNYLGNKNGQDIYFDRVSGYYYADDGWDVRRVGKVGWRPHPVDLDRLKQKLTKYSPHQVKFAGYILATYIGKEQALWDTIFKRYEMPKEPKKPHFGKNIRKARWAKYDTEYAEWDVKQKEAKAKYREECEGWLRQKEEYDASKEHAKSGHDLLSKALNPAGTKKADKFKLIVPADKKPGDKISVQAGERIIEVEIPPGSVPGTEIQFEIPPPVVTPVKVDAIPTNPFDLPPAVGTTSAVPPPAVGSSYATSTAPPPAVGSSYATSTAPPPAYNPDAPQTTSSFSTSSAPPQKARTSQPGAQRPPAPVQTTRQPEIKSNLSFNMG